ncbi:MAG: heavy-metal-associated domain-containing protein [Chitinophagaceae bacterium]
MKNTITCLLILIFSIISKQSLHAQSSAIITDTVTIKGNCGQCKERIEEAAYIKGVKEAIWDKKTKILTVTYKSNKTTLEAICKAIENVGHDSRFGQASDAEYKKLPACCAYRTGTCSHE